MKRSNGIDEFDARRLRPRQRHTWRSRLAALLCLLLVISGVLLSLAGTISLVEELAAIVQLRLERDLAFVALALGLIFLLLGLLVRRYARRLASDEGVSLSPRLMKRR